MSNPAPEPLSYTFEMVVATLAGAGVFMVTQNLWMAAMVGIVLGIGLSVLKTVYVDHKNKRPPR